MLRALAQRLGSLFAAAVSRKQGDGPRCQPTRSSQLANQRQLHDSFHPASAQCGPSVGQQAISVSRGIAPDALLRLSGWSSGLAASGFPRRSSLLAAGRGAPAAGARLPAGRRRQRPFRGRCGCAGRPADRAGAAGSTSTDRRAARRPARPPSALSGAGSRWAGTRPGRRRARTRRLREGLPGGSRRDGGAPGRRARRRGLRPHGLRDSHIPIYEYILCGQIAASLPWTTASL